MIRSLFTGIAALSLMASGVAFAQDYRDADGDSHVVVVHHSNPGEHALRGGVVGVGVGAAIGCIVTLPFCAPGAAIGAAVGGGTGAIAGAASTPPPRVDEYPPDRD